MGFHDRACSLPLLACALIACGNSTAPESPADNSPREIQASLSANRDTIESQAIVSIEVSGSGPILAHVTGTWLDTAVASVALRPFASRSVTTDANGKALVPITFGRRPGEIAIVASVPSSQVADTLMFEILPGATHSIAMSTRPILMVDSAYSFTVLARDRRGNLSAAQPLLLGHSTSLEIDTTTFQLRPTAVSGDSVRWAAVSQWSCQLVVMRSGAAGEQSCGRDLL